MARYSATCLLLISLSVAAAAFDITGQIAWNDVCHGYQDIQGARAALDDGRWSGYVGRDGRFTIPDVDPGTHVLSVVSHDFQFDQLRIDVSTAEPHVSVRAYIPGMPFVPAPSVSIPYPIILSARSRNSYFVEREGFNPLDMLKSPMMLMMLVTGGLLFATPYLMANMDKETLSEVKDRQGKLFAAQNSIQNMDIGGLTNLLSADSDSSSKSSRPAAPTAAVVPGKGKGKTRKR